ncbi:MAG: hypothetical protein DRG27_03705 [Deltaproteobacteria bacterium]|nr:MAG: hypothetical protein DRG27_03705 [Deltaproteobacteria bacterium]
MQTQIENLSQALSKFLKIKDGELYLLSKVLNTAFLKERITYREVENIAGDKDKAEDIVLLAFQWRLLIPVNPLKPTLSWEDACFLLMEEEFYVMPNIIRSLVKIASKNGIWDTEKAIQDLFKEIKDENWEIMPQIVKDIVNNAKGGNISANQIKEILARFSLKEKTNYYILILKGCGIISPHIRGVREVMKVGGGSPIYEVNPSVYPKKLSEK